jgi:GntR family transcriptional regulator
VRDELWHRIATGAWQPGVALPNEFLLSQELKVSIGTIRKAVDALVTEKAIIRQQGRGTFVTDRRSVEFRKKYDRVRNADGSFIDWRFLHAQVTTDVADEEEIAALQLRGPDPSVVRITRAREANGQLIMQERCSLPASLFQVEEPIAGHNTTIVSLCCTNGVIPGDSTEAISTIAADESNAAVFDVAVGTPLLTLDRIVYDVAGVPIEWRTALCYMRDKQYVVPASSANVRSAADGRPAHADQAGAESGETGSAR